MTEDWRIVDPRAWAGKGISGPASRKQTAFVSFHEHNREYSVDQLHGYIARAGECVDLL